MSSKPRIVLICTGLGRVNRGFEQYIASLAERLSMDKALNASVEVWSGEKVPGAVYYNQRIWSVPRSWFDRVGLKSGFLWEQRSFLAGMLWRLISQPPAVIYLGEYQLYCYLYKIRKLFQLHFSLVLYTGGQAIPGPNLFDPRRDYVHHVTDVYIEACQHIPAGRQWVLPHFLNDDFVYDEGVQRQLLSLADGRQMVLSVGLLDRQVKRMHWLIEALLPLKDEVFPVLIGTSSPETPFLEQQLLEAFGPDGFLMQEVPHRKLGDYYKIADLFVSCSPKESFGLAMIEAMWHNLPVVCFSYPESRFVLRDYADYVIGTNIPSLAFTIRRQLTNREPRMESGKAKSFVAANYTWEVLAGRYEAAFQQDDWSGSHPVN